MGLEYLIKGRVKTGFKLGENVTKYLIDNS